MERYNQILHLLKKHASGRLPDYQRQELVLLLTELPAKEFLELMEAYDHHLSSLNFDNQPDQEILAVLLSRIEAFEQQTNLKKIGWRRWAAAAAILLSMGAATWLWFGRTTPPALVVHEQPADLPPGREGAVLTLADGSQIQLDTLRNGHIADQQGVQVHVKNNRLLYDQKKNATGEPVYNTMSTPRGRQFRLTLPDGTNVWLNAASSIRYPASFTGLDRTVHVSGEAYFEVAKDSKKPFLVVVNELKVQVLGTSFNINSYSNEENIQTTLIQGSVKLHHRRNSLLLQPGQQANLLNTTQTSSLYLNKKADTDKVLAWKNGIFDFNNASLPEVLRQLERWYDIEVKFETTYIPSVEFFGKIDRNVRLGTIIGLLEKYGIRSRIENQKLIIMPNK